MFLPPSLPPARRIRSGGNKEEEEIKEIFLPQMVGGNSSTRTYYFRRCKRVRWSAAESIPDELLFEILLRLSAQDIYYSSRLVCRKWYHMMRTKNFIHKHLEHASYGLLYKDESQDVVFISPREDGGGIDTYKLNYIDKKYNYIWSSCNGLMLRYECSFGQPRYDITNVSTNKVLRLPPLPYDIYIPYLSGIGYDATSMTYKVVVIFHDLRVGCVILTIGVDKSWRRVPIDHLSYIGKLTLSSVPMSTEGFLHWQIYEGTEVVTLNLETEIIAETPPPIPRVVFFQKKYKCCCFSTGRYLSLFIQREKLVWEVFEMKPETTKWRKLAHLCLEGEKGRIERLGFKLDDVDIEPCGWLKYPEVLALFIQSSFIIFYNLITCEIGTEKLPIFECSLLDYRLLVTLHKNSLIWFGGNDP